MEGKPDAGIDYVRVSSMRTTLLLFRSQLRIAGDEYSVQRYDRSWIRKIMIGAFNAAN